LATGAQMRLSSGELIAELRNELSVVSVLRRGKFITFWSGRTRFKEQNQRRGRCAVLLDRADKEAHLLRYTVELDCKGQGQRWLLLLKGAMQAGLQIELEFRPHEINR